MAAIATVLVTEPSVLMFDEPTAFLDHKARRSLIETLNTLPHTKIVATHDLAFVAELCSRVVILKNGRIAADGNLSLLHDNQLMNSCGLEALQ
jgi:cobalt/nickel transport system ATP-binding protein